MKKTAAQMVLDCIYQGITDREQIAEMCGISKASLQGKINYLKITGKIEVDEPSRPCGQGNGSKPGIYRAVGAPVVYKSPFSFVPSIFHVGANA